MYPGTGSYTSGWFWYERSSSGFAISLLNSMDAKLDAYLGFTYPANGTPSSSKTVVTTPSSGMISIQGTESLVRVELASLPTPLAGAELNNIPVTSRNVARTRSTDTDSLSFILSSVLWVAYDMVWMRPV